MKIQIKEDLQLVIAYYLLFINYYIYMQANCFNS